MFRITHLPNTFLTSDLLWEYRIEFIAMEAICIVFAILTRVLCRDVSGALWLVVIVVFVIVDYVGMYVGPIL